MVNIQQKSPVGTTDYKQSLNSTHTKTTIGKN